MGLSHRAHADREAAYEAASVAHLELWPIGDAELAGITCPTLVMVETGR